MVTVGTGVVTRVWVGSIVGGVVGATVIPFWGIELTYAPTTSAMTTIMIAAIARVVAFADEVLGN